MLKWISGTAIKENQNLRNELKNWEESRDEYQKKGMK